MQLETFLVLLIIGVQVYFFYITFKTITAYRTLFPKANQYELQQFTIASPDLNDYYAKDILIELGAFEVDPETHPDSTTIPLLTVKKQTVEFAIIREAINTYLLRNSKATPDFALLKDIAERNNDVLDEKISSTISVPLYLGLIGTLLGIVIGLFNISDVSVSNSEEASTMLDTAIPMLLGGVRIAMFASLIGLLLTVLNSAHFLKQARVDNARNRNDFYTFLQVELLPVVNSSMEGTFRSLQSNLAKFNDDFSRSLGRLDTVMSHNSEAIVQQAELIEMLRTMDLSTVAKANVTVLKQLEKTTGTLVGFNEYLSRVNSIFNNTHQLTVKINEFLDRTSNLESLAEKAEGTTVVTQELMRFLHLHYSELSESRQIVRDAVVDVNATLGEAIGSLKRFTEEKIAEVRNIEIREEERINTEYAERWEQLGNLKYLKELVQTQNALNALQKAQGEQLAELKRVFEKGFRAAGGQSISLLEREIEAPANQSQFEEPNRLFRFLFMKKQRTDDTDEQEAGEAEDASKEASPREEAAPAVEDGTFVVSEENGQEK